MKLVKACIQREMKMEVKRRDDNRGKGSLLDVK